MITKSLLIVLLGTTFVQASPVQNFEINNDVPVRHSILRFIADMLVKTDEAIDIIYKKVKQPFKKVYNLVIQAEEELVDYGKAKAQKVLKEYYEIKSKSEQKLNELKNIALAKVINELQNFIDKLASKTDDETLEKLREKAENIAAASKEALDKLHKQLQESINAEKQKLEQKLDQWQDEADDVIKNN